MLHEVLMCAVFLIISWFLHNYINKSHAPPGPLKIPVLGNLIQIAKAHKKSYLAFHKLSQQYGPVMSLKLGFSNIVLLSSYEAMKTILNKDEAAGRDQFESAKLRNNFKNIGILFCDGETWRKMRSFSIATLRDYGYGQRHSMGEVISNEVQDFCNHLKYLMKGNNGIVDFDTLFNVTVINVLWTIIGNKKLDYSDKKVKYLVDTSIKVARDNVSGAGLLMAFPFLRYIAPDLTGHKANKKIFQDWRDFFQELLEEYRENYKKTKEVNCFIDSFIQKIEENKNDPNTLFTDEQFGICTMDLFQAGSETSSGNLNFAMLFMILQPDIQKKIQNEIESVIGNFRLPHVDDRLKMPYTQATILEVFRWGRVTVTLVPRKATKDFSYKIWTIKKDTVIISNTHSVFFDEEFWGDPNSFRPERFLNENGKICADKAERIIPFGLGKRICPGETLGRDTFFLYLTTLLQKFSFEMVPGDEPSTEIILGFTLNPVPFRALIKERIA